MGADSSTLSLGARPGHIPTIISAAVTNFTCMTIYGELADQIEIQYAMCTGRVHLEYIHKKFKVCTVYYMYIPN